MRFLFSRISGTGRWKVERLAGLSDGVIAIVITLLVLGLEVPSVHDVPDAELGEYLIDSLFPIVGYVLSFLLIGMYWMQHFAIFHFLTHANRPFVVLNLMFLLCLTFLPFPTGLHAVYRDDEMAVVLYGVAQILCGLSLMLLWYYATEDRRLVRNDMPPEIIRNMMLRLAASPVLCVIAIGASFLNPWISRFIFFAIPFCYLSQRVVDEGWAKMEGREES